MPDLTVGYSTPLVPDALASLKARLADVKPIVVSEEAKQNYEAFTEVLAAARNIIYGKHERFGDSLQRLKKALEEYDK